MNPAGFGQNVTFTVVVQTGAGTGKLSGTVTFFDGTAALASGVVPDAQGSMVTAIYSTASLGVGKHSISVMYSGDAGHLGSSSTAANGAGLQQPPLIEDILEGTSTKVVSSADPSAPGESVTFTATVAALPVGGVTPDGSITFMDGTTILANVALNASATATYTTATLAAGAHPISSTYGGDAAKDILGSTSLTLNQQVLTATTNTLTSSQNPSICGAAVTFTSTVAASGGGAGLGAIPAGLVNFLNDGVKIGSASLTGNPAAAAFTTSALSAATHTISAEYAGDMANAASNSEPLTQTVTVAAMAPSFSVTLAPALTLKTTETATLTVTLASSSGFTDTVGLGCASLPVGVSCHFSPVSVALDANGSSADHLTIVAFYPLTGGDSAMIAHRGDRSSSLAGALATLSVMFGAILWHFRKRHKGVWNVLLALLLSATTLLVAGCSGTIVIGAAPGVYVIQVTGTGISTNTIHYQNVTLTITK